MILGLIHPEQHEPVLAMSVVDPLKRGHFLTAGWTLRCPEIDDEHLPASGVVETVSPVVVDRVKSNMRQPMRGAGESGVTSGTFGSTTVQQSARQVPQSKPRACACVV